MAYGQLGGARRCRKQSPSRPEAIATNHEAIMAKSKKNDGGEEIPEFGGFLGGLGNIIGKLSELAEKGKELHELKEFGGQGGSPKGVYGFTIRSNIGEAGNRDGGVKVEPFGNVRKDDKTGRATVHEVTEPPVDVFDEAGYVLVVVEMPGIGEEDLRLELRDDILAIAAEKGPKKYRKEVLLPGSFGPGAMTHTCRNGVLEIKLAR
jgi:HSP20 family protein